MEGLNSVAAMRLFAVIGDTIAAKPDRKSIAERTLEFVEELHEAGFVIVPRPPEVLLNDE